MITVLGLLQYLKYVYRNRGALAGQQASRGWIGRIRSRAEGIAPAANVLHRRDRCSCRWHCAGAGPWLDRLAQLASGLGNERGRAGGASRPLFKGSSLIWSSVRDAGALSLEDVHRTLLDLQVCGSQRWPVGLPVICGSNQAELGLANGDLGVKLGAGETPVCSVCWLRRQRCGEAAASGRLQRLELVALTIHRAQGGEAKSRCLAASVAGQSLDHHASGCCASHGRVTPLS